MRALFVKGEDDETDAESDGDTVEEVFELFQLCRERKLLKLMCHEGQLSKKSQTKLNKGVLTPLFWVDII